MLNKFYTLLFFNIFLISSAIIGFFFGYITPLFENDISHISYIILSLMIVNTILFHYDTFITEILKNVSEHSLIKEWLYFIETKYLYFGLIGTIIGMVHLISAMSTGSDISELLRVMKEGSLTLFNTSLLGVVAYVLSTFNFFILRNKK